MSTPPDCVQACCVVYFSHLTNAPMQSKAFVHGSCFVTEVGKGKGGWYSNLPLPRQQQQQHPPEQAPVPAAGQEYLGSDCI